MKREYKLIPLSDDKLTIIDLDDYDKVKHLNWKAIKGHSTFYVHSNANKKIISMHRLIMGVYKPEQIIDHKNRDGLDNRKSNLRIATKQQNNCNAAVHKNSKHGMKGVTYKGKNWEASITINYENVYLGTFHTIFDAAIAYDNAALEHFGEFALTNQMMGLIPKDKIGSKPIPIDFRWTKEQEAKLVELRKAGATNDEIGKILGKTAHAIRLKIRALDKQVGKMTKLRTQLKIALEALEYYAPLTYGSVAQTALTQIREEI